MLQENRICIVTSCKQLKTGKKDFCRKHQTRFERHGSPEVNNRSPIKIGEKFGRLTVEKKVGKDKSGNSLYSCSCSCGGSATTRSHSLRSGRTSSCGCWNKEVLSRKKPRLTPKEKKCSLCGQKKLIECFGKKKESVDGHKSQCKPCGRLWHKKNRHRVSETNRHRRRKIDSATPTWVDRFELQKLELERVKIENRTDQSYEIDHIIPIKHPLICGLHVPWNLQIVTAEYNNAKGNRVSYEFLQQNGRGSSLADTQESQLVCDLTHIDALWNADRNMPLMPHMVHVTCPVVVWWSCKKGHDWSKSVPNMIKNFDCPICEGREEVGFSNSTIAPKIAKQWDYEKNHPWKPGDFRRKSGKEVHWICDHGHPYEKTIAARAVGVGCPTCAELGIRKKRTKFSEKIEIFSFENQNGTGYQGTIHAFAKKFRLLPHFVNRLVKGEQTTHKGWFIQGNSPHQKLLQVELTHNSLGRFNGSVPQMVAKYGVNRNSIYKVVNGQAFSHHGWKLVGSERSRKMIVVKHTVHGTFEGTASELVRKYEGLTAVGVSNLIRRRTYTHRGWHLPGRVKPEKIVKLFHPTHGKFEGRALELIKVYPDLDSGGLSRVSNGLQLHHKGWKKLDDSNQQQTTL